MEHLQFALVSAILVTALFLGIILFIELGRRYGMRQTRKLGEDARVGVGVVDSAVYSLLALLIGFAFSGAAGRFDKRREMVAHQVNAVSTAWNRIDLLAPAQQPAIRTGFRHYLDALLTAYDHPAGSPAELRARQTLANAQNEIWSRITDFSLTPEGEKARVLIIPSVNEMFDAVDTERLAQRLHPPMMIYIMLAITALASALFAGYAMSTGSRRNWMYIIGVAATVSIAVFVTLELESPRLGWIRVDGIDVVLVELRESMNAPDDLTE